MGSWDFGSQPSSHCLSASVLSAPQHPKRTESALSGPATQHSLSCLMCLNVFWWVCPVLFLMRPISTRTSVHLTDAVQTKLTGHHRADPCADDCVKFIISFIISRTQCVHLWYHVCVSVQVWSSSVQAWSSSVQVWSSGVSVQVWSSGPAACDQYNCKRCWGRRSGMRMALRHLDNHLGR